MTKLDPITPKLKSYKAEEMPHNGRISVWERHTPNKLHYKLYFHRAVGSKGMFAGLFEFSTKAKRDEALLRLKRVWEANNLPYITPKAYESLQKYSDYMELRWQEKQEKNLQKDDLRTRLQAIEALRK